MGDVSKRDTPLRMDYLDWSEITDIHLVGL